MWVAGMVCAKVAVEPDLLRSIALLLLDIAEHTREINSNSIQRSIGMSRVQERNLKPQMQHVWRWIAPGPTATSFVGMLGYTLVECIPRAQSICTRCSSVLYAVLL
jgi:hypothetical protein